MSAMRPLRVAAALSVLLAAGTALAAPALPPAPERWVTDQAGFLSAGTRATLDQRLESYERATGHQVLVWIGKTLEGQSLEEWAARTFAAWGVGRKGLDDGAAIFLLADDRRVRIEVGYGLEDRLTDLAAARIIRERMVPRLQAGDRDGAITTAVDGVLAAIGSEGAPAAEQEPERAVGERGRPGTGSLVLFGIVAAIFLFILITNPRLAIYLLLSMGSGGRRGGWGGGGWGGGGGGFSGGGGRSGGGGASGSW
jgi:uncharacterized protein